MHITKREDWETATASAVLSTSSTTDAASALSAGVTTPPYRAESLETEGFIHCSTVEQVLKPANEMFRGQIGLILLVINPAKVQAEIVYEDCYETGQQFPHIYGPLNLDAVVKVVDFPPNADGSFSLPLEIRKS